MLKVKFKIKFRQKTFMYFFYKQNQLGVLKKIMLYNNFKKILEKKKYFIKTGAKFVKKFKLKISFGRRNTFFSILSPNNEIIEYTTIRRQGFYGRTRKSFIALQSTLRKIKERLKKLKIKNLETFFIGWSRFRFLLKKTLSENKKRYRIIRFKNVTKLKVPHNGSLPKKSKNRRRLRWKRFFKRLKRKKFKKIDKFQKTIDSFFD